MRLLACLIVAPQRGYDEPAILSYAISSFCPTSADGLQSAQRRLGNAFHILADQNVAEPPLNVGLPLPTIDVYFVRHPALSHFAPERFLDRRPLRFRRRSSPAGRLRRARRWRVSGGPVAGTSHERRNELFSIEAEVCPNHSAAVTLGCPVIQGADRERLPGLRGDGLQLSVGVGFKNPQHR